MNKNHFDFWYKGHQILAVRDHDDIFHFYVGLVDASRIEVKSFKRFLANNVENDDLIKIATEFKEPFANKNLYSMYALSFFSTKKAGIEVAMHLCEAVSMLDYPEKDYREFKFNV